MYKLYNPKYIQREIVDWAMAGSPVPAPHPVKVLHLAWLIQLANLSRFIETGTLAGNTSGMIGLMSGVRVDTIEITEHYFHLANEKFGGNPQIYQHLGDSTFVLPQILEHLDVPALFWLDAHHSMGKTGCGEKLTPVSEEIETILHHSTDGHVVAIDDIRSFTGRADYPVLAQLVEMLKDAKPHYGAKVIHDILTFAPNEILAAMDKTPFRMNDIKIISQS